MHVANSSMSILQIIQEAEDLYQRAGFAGELQN